MTISQIKTGFEQGEWGDGSIIPIPPDRRAEAVQCLVGSRPGSDSGSATRFMQHAEAHGVVLDAMWGRLNGAGRIEQTVLAVPSKGRTAMIFATRPRLRSEIPLIGGLIDYALTSFDPTIANLAQALLEPAARMERRGYLAGGFEMLAMLSYLRRAIPSHRSSTAAEWPSDVEVVAYDDSRRADLMAVLSASYEQTMDCPRLRGLRDTSDILIGHQTTGVFVAELWTLLYIDGVPSGAVLINASSNGDAMELVYLGLAVHARGRGLGRMLLRHGLHQLVGRAERSIVLAVDERNQPALSVYRREGFRPTLRRAAMIRSLHVEASESM